MHFWLKDKIQYKNNIDIYNLKSIVKATKKVVLIILKL